MTTTVCMPDTACTDERPWQRTRLRAPQGDMTFVAQPSLGEARQVAGTNRERLASLAIDVQGRPLAALRSWARREALRAAKEYTQGVLGTASKDHSKPDVNASTIFVSGHQPALFHAGVWVKNFVVDRLARGAEGIGLNLIVDNDALTSTSIRVPTGSRTSPRFEDVGYDAIRGSQPWEERPIVDRAQFESFPQRVAGKLAEWGFRPLLEDYWPAAAERSRYTRSLVECLTAARLTWERNWGAHNLELPISRLCELEPFLWFASHLLAHLPRFHAIHNRVLREYREVYRIRSRTHPVSDLRAFDGWLEAPFWVWRAGDSTRRRVFARQAGGEVLLSDGREQFAALSLAPQQEACCAVDALARFPAQGLRMRTRALSTTLFARLCLADLFVHGLGGAKYDELTDRLISRFFGLKAPGYLMLSGTLQLPLGSHGVDRADEQRVRQQLRELTFHGERWMTAGPDHPGQALIDEKRRLVEEQHAAEEARRAGETSVGWSAARRSGYDRWRRLQEINQKLSAYTRHERARLEQDLKQTREQLSADAILHNREFAACLHPSDRLRRFIEHVRSFA